MSQGPHAGPKRGAWRQQLLPLLPLVPAMLAMAAGTAAAQLTMPGPGDALMQQFSASEQLGGEITVVDLQAPSLSPLALAEQGRVRNSPDPLQALPSRWRQPLRNLLPPQSTLRWQRARVVHGSWPNLQSQMEVPLVLYSDGSVDVFLDSPGAGLVEAALKNLLLRLDTPPAGSLQPLLFELQPRLATSPLRPSSNLPQ